MSPRRHQPVNCVIQNRMTPWCRLRLSGRCKNCRGRAGRCRQAPFPKSAAFKKIKKASFQNMYIRDHTSTRITYLCQMEHLGQSRIWQIRTLPGHQHTKNTHTHANIYTSAHMTTHAHIHMHISYVYIYIIFKIHGHTSLHWHEHTHLLHKSQLLSMTNHDKSHGIKVYKSDLIAWSDVAKNGKQQYYAILLDIHNMQSHHIASNYNTVTYIKMIKHEEIQDNTSIQSASQPASQNHT